MKKGGYNGNRLFNVVSYWLNDDKFFSVVVLQRYTILDNSRLHYLRIQGTNYNQEKSRYLEFQAFF